MRSWEHRRDLLQHPLPSTRSRENHQDLFRSDASESGNYGAQTKIENGIFTVEREKWEDEIRERSVIAVTWEHLKDILSLCEASNCGAWKKVIKLGLIRQLRLVLVIFLGRNSSQRSWSLFSWFGLFWQMSGKWKHLLHVKTLGVYSSIRSHSREGPSELQASVKSLPEMFTIVSDFSG